MKLSNKVSNTICNSQIRVRPTANPGLWLVIVLPVCVITSVIKHPLESSHLYKTYSIFSFGLLLTSLLFIYECSNRKHVRTVSKLYVIPAVVTGFLYHICLHRGFLFCVVSGFVPTILYNCLYVFLLRTLPLSFSLGEAAIVTQGLVLFFYSTSINIYNTNLISPKTTLEISTLIVQFGLSGIGLICCCTFLFASLKKPTKFYVAAGAILLGFVFIPLHVILKESALVWIVRFILQDFTTLIMLLYWGLCSVLAVVAVAKQIFGAKKASTVTRKVFHILAVAVYIPGLIHTCTFLYLASGVALGIFVVLEMLRVLNMPPLGKYLQDGFIVFSDEKDTGVIALTPIYLLVGCSLPLWLHPAPCDLTNSAGFNLLPLLSGILSIGVGDTAASLIGTCFGKHQWSGTKKTIEGTIACILTQLGLVYCLIYLDYVQTNMQLNMKVGAAIVIGSLIEAKTSQVDNLVIPLVMFTIIN